MSYSINYSDLTKIPLVVEDGTINANTDLYLLGRSVSGYGQYVAQNFLYLLENFASDNSPQNPIEGQIWYDTANDLLKYYTKSGIWKTTSSTTVTTEPPSGTSIDGDIWYDTINDYLYIYADGEWKNILQFDANNRVMINNRYDNNGVVHKTMEFLLNGKIVYIITTDDTTWIPSSYGTTAERMPDGRLLVADYPTLKKGLNLNYDRSYNIHNFYVTQLGEVTVDVGLGDVYIEQNAYDGAGPGFTIRPSSDPLTNFSMFSVRSTNNDSKLWIGTETTSVGTNRFATGFTGNTGEEYDISKYNVVLNTDGTVEAINLTLTGDATIQGDIGTVGTIAAASASGEWVAVEADIDAGTSNTKIVTPAMLDYAILNNNNFTSDTKVIANLRKSTTGGSYPVLEYIVNNEIVKITYTYDALTVFQIADSELDYQGRQLNNYFRNIVLGDNYPSKGSFTLLNPTTTTEIQTAFSQVTKPLPADHDPNQVRSILLNVVQDENLTGGVYDPNNPDQHIVYVAPPKLTKGMSYATRYSTTLNVNYLTSSDPEYNQEVGVWKDVCTVTVPIVYREWIPAFSISTRIFASMQGAQVLATRLVQAEIPNVSVEKIVTYKTYDLFNVAGDFGAFDYSMSALTIPALYAFIDPLYDTNDETQVTYKLQTQIPTGASGTVHVLEGTIEAVKSYLANSGFTVSSSDKYIYTY